MRIRFNILLTILSYSCASIAGLPLKWNVETSRAVHTKFDAYQGETLSFEATLQSYGKPLEAPAQYAFYWQTNGMGNAYWSAPCTVPDASRVAGAVTNVLFATFTPDMDVGAKSYNCFIGLAGSIYHAAFQLNLRPSPGAIPNELPFPQKVIDFATVEVRNAPWPSAGSARPLPKYLHELSFDDTYPDEAAWFYALPHDYSSCSAVRDGDFLCRNYDWRLDDAAEFVVRMSAGEGRFASVGVANCGTNLSEQIATSGKWSRYYRCLPGRTVDGINENGVCAEVNVVGGDPLGRWPTNGTIHCMGAVRWVLDHATDAGMAASNLVEHLYFPAGFTQNFHWMVADAEQTWIVENGTCSNVTGRAVMTNFPLLPTPGEGAGRERYELLLSPAYSITNAWYTRAYSRDTEWVSEFKDPDEMEAAKSAWETYGKEALRGKGLWQTVHTSVYDLTNRTLRVAVQEVDDWYTFALNAPATKAELDSKRDKTNLTVYAVQEITEWVPDAHGQTLGLTGQPSIEWYGEENPGRFFCYWGDYASYNNGPEDETITFSHPESGDEFTAHKAVVGRTVVPTGDTLAKKSETATPADLALKRDLDDLAYVTTVPGGWTPTEVDGHRYDIYYDGHSGWYVEKLTYYPEWGEWYYDDYEWVEGPEDAETIVAHKIWSDETITFMRQQVEVQDSLALVSQIGNQAEIAARDYIQNNDIAKTKTILRTGKPGEYGTGWGTMHYQFSSDRRWWSMIVPTLTATVTSGGYVDAGGNDVTASTLYYGPASNYCRADPLSVRDHTPILKFDRSDGTNGEARCQSAEWLVGITGGSGSSTSQKYDNALDADACCLLAKTEVHHADGFLSLVPVARDGVAPIEFDRSDYYYYSNHYVLGNFRYDAPVVSDTSASVRCRYDVAASTGSYRTNFTAWCTINLTSSGTYVTTNPDYGRVLTDTTRGLYYDSGLKATWRVAVTNGCFFTEIVSTNNVTEGVN